jgi:hypothetical protein
MTTTLATKVESQRVWQPQGAPRMQAHRNEALSYRAGARGRRVEDLARYGGGLTGRELIEMARAVRVQPLAG